MAIGNSLAYHVKYEYHAAYHTIASSLHPATDFITWPLPEASRELSTSYLITTDLFLTY